MRILSLVDKAFLLKKISLFERLDLDLLLTIAERAQQVQYESGDVIFHLRQNAHRMFLIIDGEVQIRNDNHEPIWLLKTLDFFGDESMFNEQPRGYEAVAATESDLLSLSRTDLLSIINECPSVAIALLEVYSSSTSFRPRRI